MASPLVSITDFEKWVQEDPIAREDFAALVLDWASRLVRETCKHDEWTSSTAPFTAKRITLLVAKRTYQNPGQEIATAIGPLSSRVLDEAAAGMRLTDQERAELLPLIGDGTPGSDPNRVWILTNGGGIPPVSTGFVFDDSGSDWAIPYVDFDSTDAMMTPADTIIP